MPNRIGVSHDHGPDLRTTDDGARKVARFSGCLASAIRADTEQIASVDDQINPLSATNP
jgi:hypothetical protein